MDTRVFQYGGVHTISNVQWGYKNFIHHQQQQQQPAWCRAAQEDLGRQSSARFDITMLLQVCYKYETNKNIIKQKEVVALVIIE